MENRVFNRVCLLIVSILLIIGLFQINTVSIYAEDTTDYLCFTAETDGASIRLTKEGSPTSVNLEYKKNDGSWQTYSIDNVINLNSNEKVQFRCISESTTHFSSSEDDYYFFDMVGTISGSGDVTTLINKNGTTDLTNAGSYCFYMLFNSSFVNGVGNDLIVAPELPATTLTNYCYSGMFESCQSLIVAPFLPATTLAEGCYQWMFAQATELKVAPELPATVLAKNCYYGMFTNNCFLEISPELPATTLAEGCYAYMFHGFSSLIVPPELPAIVLADNCYSYMLCGSGEFNDIQVGDYTASFRIPTSGSFVTRGNSDLEGMIDGGGAYRAPTVNDGAIILYYKPVSVSLTYDGNGADSGTVPIDGSYNVLDTVTVKGNTGSLTKINNIFKGWSLRPDGKGKSYNADDTFDIKGNTTLYALWDDYSFISGNGQTYIKGTLENKLFVSGGPLANLTSVQVDDIDIVETIDYLKESGSTKITLLGTYLETLGLGSHTLKLTYSDGPTPTVTFNVVNPSGNNGGNNSGGNNNNNNKYVVPNTGV